MVVDGLVLSVIVGFFRKGNLKWLANPLFKWGWIFPLLLVIQLLVFYLQNSLSFIAEISQFVYIFVYLLGLFFLWVNRHHKGFNILLVGVLLNFLVIFFNGGRMPVSEEAASVLDPIYIDALKNSLYAKHTLLTESTNLAFLGDIIPISSPYPKTQVISIGDVIMNIGIFLFIQDKMVDKRQDSSPNRLKGGEAI